MKTIRLSQNVISITDFKTRASEWLQKIAETEEPVVITQNGQAVAVMLSPAAYDELTENLRFVASVEEGLRDARAGRTSDHDDVGARLLGRFGAK